MGRYYWYRMQNNQWKIIEDQIPTKIPIELNYNSNSKGSHFELASMPMPYFI
jgi:hypothetical protein